MRKYRKDDYEDKRSFERESCNFKVEVKDPAIYALKNAKGYNISATGMGIKSSYALTKNREVTVKIHFSKKHQPFKA